MFEVLVRGRKRSCFGLKYLVVLPLYQLTSGFLENIRFSRHKQNESVHWLIDVSPTQTPPLPNKDISSCTCRLKHVWSVWIQNLLEDHFQIITCCKVAAAARRFVTNNHPGSTLTLRRHQPLLQGFGLISQDSNRIPAVKLQVKLNTKVPVH